MKIYKVNIINGMDGWSYFYNNKEQAEEKFKNEIDSDERNLKYRDVTLSKIETTIPFKKFEAYQKDKAVYALPQS